MAWPGGKDGSGVAQRLISLFPPHDLFVVPCLGDCAVLRRKRPARFQIGVDSDRRAVDRFGPKWRSRLPLSLICGDGLAVVSQLFRLGWVDVGADGNGGAVPGVWIGGTVVPFSAVAVFFDPPYPLETRRGGRIYREEWDRVKHVDGLRIMRECAALGAAVVVCSYPNDFYEAELSGWRSFSHQVGTRSGPREEKVWLSFDPPEILHDGRFVGADRRDREPRSRRARRLVARFKRIDRQERAALLQALDSAGLVERAVLSPSESEGPVRQSLSGDAVDVGVKED